MKTQSQVLLLSIDLEIMSNEKLGLLDKLIFSYISNWEQKAGHCFVKEDTLSKITGENLDDIQTSIQKLVDLKLINQVKGIGGHMLKVRQPDTNLVAADMDIFVI